MELPDSFGRLSLPDSIDQSLLEQAFIHSSYANEKGLSRDNERLEFLGDATIDLIVARELFVEFPDRPEGKLSKTKSGIVSTRSLARIARRLQLDEYLRLSRGQQKLQRGQEKLYEDCFEAFVGAIFLSTDYETTRDLILPELMAELERHEEATLHNPKGTLLEITQEHGWDDPDYELIEVRGPEHKPYHVIRVNVRGENLGQGEGRKKIHAEQQAAREAIQRLREDPPDWASGE